MEKETVFYRCDPSKNTDCKKGVLCQMKCFYTTKKGFSSDGKPVGIWRAERYARKGRFVC